MASSRPFNALLISLFAILAVAGLYFLRVEPALKDIPIGFQEILGTGKHSHGFTLKTSYTGIGPVDALLSLLVAAFLPGIIGWEPQVRLQQIHFLFTFFSLCSITNIEANRERNRGRFIT